MQEEERFLEITESDCKAFKRLDQCLAAHMSDLGRNFIKKLYHKNLIAVGDGPASPGKLELKKMPPVGTKIILHIPPPAPACAPENIPLECLFEDQHLVIINKKAGMVVHPGAGQTQGTLANAIVYHYPELREMNQPDRPGIVHRLDKGTSGVMVVAKQRECYEKLVLLFSAHDIERKYWALCLKGKLPAQGTLKSMIGRHPRQRLKMTTQVEKGKRALTHYRVLEDFGPCCLVEFTLETGRTHQIRVHASELLKSPVVMDSLYGRPRTHLKSLPQKAAQFLEHYPHPLLHAGQLGFKHPITGEQLSFCAPVPEVFEGVLEILRDSGRSRFL